MSTSKKQDFLRDEQSRDKHPERDRMSSPTAATGATSQGGKVAHAHNKTGSQEPAQIRQGRRAPERRHDRQSQGAGLQNQVSAYKGDGGCRPHPSRRVLPVELQWIQ